MCQELEFIAAISQAGTCPSYTAILSCEARPEVEQSAVFSSTPHSRAPPRPTQRAKEIAPKVDTVSWDVITAHEATHRLHTFL